MFYASGAGEKTLRVKIFVLASRGAFAADRRISKSHGGWVEAEGESLLTAETFPLPRFAVAQAGRYSLLRMVL